MNARMESPATAAFCLALLRRQLTLAARRPIEIGNPLLFFAMVVVPAKMTAVRARGFLSIMRGT